MKRRQFWLMGPVQGQATKDTGFHDTVLPVAAGPVPTGRDPASGWDPHEVWRTRVKTVPRKPPSD